MHSFRLALIAAALILFGASSGYGAGFAMYEYGARGNALGGGLVGRADDPSALAYNPAGITQLEGTGFMAGTTVINPLASVEIGGEEVDAESKYWTPPHLYVTQQLDDTFWLGFGLYSRYGLGIEYDSDWAGRYNMYEAQIQSISMSPTLAVKVTDWLSVAAGPEIMWFEFKQKKAIPFGGDPANDIDASLEGDSWGYGAIAGLHVTPNEWLKLGFTYRSKVKQKVDGEADFTKSVAAQMLYPAFFEDMGAKGEITLPDSYTFGVAVYPMDKLSVEFDAVYTRWSSFDELKINFEDDFAPPSKDSTVSEKDWNDVWRYQVSAEYALLNWLDLRASYVYDNTPIPDAHVDYMVPANDRQLYGAGLGFHITEALDLDLSYTYLDIKERDVAARTSEGIQESKFVDGHAHLYGISMAYRF
ncbi:membrane protein involved in aromatic hydrocarbon degradation [Desulfocurvibacter africanus subsp. africanus str. Walvis Bay]|uniref:Membrane protein involved in aromatic hydrocarbon degradation n=1 Tax=Desulfocurvibacter africanus subsp. africanus str. Walvis Bay TaxID=690850 RepID=F3YTX0_DESAF|nr:membrane protein involved in aromatic hydrocarbon degradation [Desulfocurvibacter africanus subsp. africanus str. Walvis Bay]